MASSRHFGLTILPEYYCSNNYNFMLCVCVCMSVCVEFLFFSYSVICFFVIQGKRNRKDVELGGRGSEK